jgi:hypothetical protein
MWSGIREFDREYFGRDTQLELYIRAKLIPLAGADTKELKHPEPYHYIDDPDFTITVSKVIRDAAQDIADRLNVKLEPLRRFDFRPGSIDVSMVYEVIAKSDDVLALTADFSDKITKFEEMIAKQLEHRLSKIAKFKALTSINLVLGRKTEGRETSRQKQSRRFAETELTMFALMVLILLVSLIYFAMPSRSAPKRQTDDPPCSSCDLSKMQADISRIQERLGTLEKEMQSDVAQIQKRLGMLEDDVQRPPACPCDPLPCKTHCRAPDMKSPPCEPMPGRRDVDPDCGD